ncbi:MAG: hypothetical protein V4710_10490 [Verrucomicrobiota bacterium]
MGLTRFRGANSNRFQKSHKDGLLRLDSGFVPGKFEKPTRIGTMKHGGNNPGGCPFPVTRDFKELSFFSPDLHGRKRGCHLILFKGKLANLFAPHVNDQRLFSGQIGQRRDIHACFTGVALNEKLRRADLARLRFRPVGRKRPAQLRTGTLRPAFLRRRLAGNRRVTMRRFSRRRGSRLILGRDINMDGLAPATGHKEHGSKAGENKLRTRNHEKEVKQKRKRPWTQLTFQTTRNPAAP